MEKLLSSAASSHKTVPELRPPALAAAPVSLPVIDLSRSRDEVRSAVLRAGKEFGFFQVINHDVPERTMRELEVACVDFFRLPAADKAAFYSEDTEQTNRLFSSTIVGMELLRLLCGGIGLRPDYFEGDISGGEVILNANHYPPCPDPGLTLGLPPHCDRNLITVLLQPGYVCGLQVSYDGGWIDVEPVPGALVINFGHQLEIATNGLLRSVEHRAVANAAVARTSVAAFIMPTMDCVVEPAKELAGKGSPAKYRSITFRDFMRVYKTVGARRESVEKAFRI
ncbi:hypothetical protein ACQ4PT_031999 [Festuca glaucescens]